MTPILESEGVLPIWTPQTSEFMASRVATREGEKPLPRFLKSIRDKSGAQIRENGGIFPGKRVSNMKSGVYPRNPKKRVFYVWPPKTALFLCVPV